MRTRTWFNTDWQFFMDASCGETLPAGDLNWQNVTLPHDWQIWHVKALYADGTGWYRKHFNWQPGSRCALYFEGVYMDAAVFVNGIQAKEWKYGYSSFEADITDFLHEGENVILVRCLLHNPSSRWYSGAGIYRDVWMLQYPETHLVTDGLYVSPRELSEGHWQITASAEFVGEADTIEYTLLDDKGTAIVSTTGTEEIILPVEAPKLWDLKTPNCYTFTAKLLKNGEVLDTLETTCGFRTVEIFPDKGLFLNHNRVVLKGVCLHHDLGCLGAAFCVPAARRQLAIMQDMGVNALRTSHNMPAPGLMQLADEMGILVIDEAFDCWRLPKTTYDYGRFFPEWYKRDVASWVRRDRNHPSLIMWSIGNEIYDTHKDAQGRQTAIDLLTEVARHDPRKNGLKTFGSNYMAWENTQKCGDLFDAVGYNYGENLYDAHHREHPDWVIYGSETASVVQSRGIYHFPLTQPLLMDDDLQCSSLGNSRTSWGAKSHQFCVSSDERYPYNLGQFLWTGIDYIGEPTPYHTKNSYFGMVDTAGFPKDAFYVYQAGWHDWHEKPVLHLLPYWDFNPGQLIDVCILSNLPQVELIVNGVSQGRKSLRGGSDSEAHWQVPYASGSIQAIGYDESGNIVKQETETSFGDGAKLCIEADRTAVDNSGRDLVFCTITVADRDGNPVRNAVNYVQVNTTGALELVGMDNGNSADKDEYKTNVRRLFSGKLLAVAAGSGSDSWGRITVTAPGLESASVELNVLPAAETAPIAPKISMDAKAETVPVRKIALTADATLLTPENPVTRIHAQILPVGADAGDLSWRVTDIRGITVSNVVLEPEGDNTMRVTGIGDGKVSIRCMSGLLISDLAMEVKGMGSVFLNPYTYTSAGLYTQSHAEIGNGNDRGIATSRTEMSWVAFERMDFGRQGADTFTIDVFEMSSVPTPIRFWKGIPYAPGSKMIGERIYDKPSIWNVYQPETYQLDEPLTNQDIFAIELQCKVHIRGFQFEQRTRAFDCIPALGYDALYGDTFTQTETAVTGIGNNVSLVFKDMDFGTSGTAGIAIRGRSHLEINTIHLVFEGPDGTQRRVAEFTASDDWTQQRFSFDPVYGKQDLTFVFLPGCDFDFESFRCLPE